MSNIISDNAWVCFSSSFVFIRPRKLYLKKNFVVNSSEYMIYSAHNNFILLIDVKISTIVGILTYVSSIE